MNRKPNIVVVGGGAGGLELMRHLGQHCGDRARLTLVDSQTTHIWKPRLHELASGALDAERDAVEYRAHALRNGYDFVNGTMIGIDRRNRRIVIDALVGPDGERLGDTLRLDYDYLAVGVGSTINDFSTKGALENSEFLNDQPSTEHLRKKLLLHLQHVSRQLRECPDGDAAVRVIIVGGGATGVELGAALMNAVKGATRLGLVGLDPERLQITIVEAGPTILPQLPDAALRKAEKELAALNIQIRTAARVAEVSQDGVVIDNEGEAEPLVADMVVWAAGAKAPDFLKDFGGLENNKAGQLVVRPNLQTTRDDRIFAFGDCAGLPTGDGWVPMRAQAAQQMASCVAENLRRVLADEPLKAFAFKDHGSIVSLKSRTAVGALFDNDVVIDGIGARLAYNALYRGHQMNVHGPLRGGWRVIRDEIAHLGEGDLKLH